MLNPDDRSAIEGLFSRLRDVESRTDARDPEAEALIREEISRQPGAPYYMAQTILVQEHALSVAERRIAELEEQLERRPSDFLGGLFGGGRDTQRTQYQTPTRQEPARQERGPWDRNDRNADNRGGGGFLAGAAQTALGVTGGLLLGSAIGSLFGAGAAQAGEAPADQQQDQQDTDQPDSGNDGGDGDFGGGDFGDGGGFDMGGDF
jgi:uncharacterized protein